MLFAGRCNSQWDDGRGDEWVSCRCLPFAFSKWSYFEVRIKTIGWCASANIAVRAAACLLSRMETKESDNTAMTNV